MDKEKIFGLFDKHFDEGVNAEVELYKKTFRFKIEMFIKIVIYGEKWKSSVVNIFSKADSDLNVKEIDEAGDFMLYTRAWFWIEQFDFNNDDCLEDLRSITHTDKDSFNGSDLFISLMRAIKYFEKIEEFEKCAFLVKIRDLSK